MRRSIVCLLALIATLPVYAESQESPGLGVLLPAISVTSDYRFNGMSLSDRQPVVQGSLHLWRPDGYYAGMWLSQVDFRDGSTDIELDTYIGRNISHGEFETKLELMYLSFDDNIEGVPTYDFLQLKAGVKRKMKQVTVGATALWSPSGSAGAGRVTQIRVEGESRISDYFKVSGVLGRRIAERSVDRSYWDLGMTLEWKTWDLDFRYYNSNLELQQCFYTDWCEGGFATTLTFASY